MTHSIDGFPYGSEDFGGSDEGSHLVAGEMRLREPLAIPTDSVFDAASEIMGCSDPWAVLRELVRSEGFTLVIDDGAPDRVDRMGAPQRDELCAQACTNNVIAVRSQLQPDFAWYAVSHEIAESRCDFTGHHQLLWREQLTILARWCRRLSKRL